MLDVRLIRENPDTVRDSLRRRSDSTSLALIDDVLRLDGHRRDSQSKADDLRAQLNTASKTFGSFKGHAAQGGLDPSDVLEDAGAMGLLTVRGNHNSASLAQRTTAELLELLQSALRELSDTADDAVGEVSATDRSLNEKLMEFPNLPLPSAPVGDSESDNVEVRQWGEIPLFDGFEPKPHWDLAPDLGILDFDRGTRISGSRFYVLRGRGARLQRSLISWMLSVHTAEHGYTELYLPALVTEETLRASGQLPKFADNLYRDTEDDLWLVPTAEVPLTSMHRGEILEAAQLPLRYAAYTPCFRREKMSAGRDVRGIKRGHQFDKVEMYKFVEPETSIDELETMTADAEDLLQRLGLTYRVVELCTGDLGSAAAKTYDIEVWAPGCQEWLEVSSCSTTEDYQARRADIRYRPEPGARPQFVHTLNGSGLALPRVLIALLETYQQPDGSVTIPEALHAFTGFDRLE
ncbi:MAG: serine--tRNA ligase [Dehalococcoidia bacterium]|nr:serine--tRNA ligase [Dehalococcoidia bacterium]